MNYLLPKYLLPILLYLHGSCNTTQQGSTDPPALNFSPSATEDDISCKYQIASVEPEWSLELDAQINETSGLIHWDGVLWTHNDDTDTRLYLLDPATAENVGNYDLPGVINQDWEEIAQDDDFIYVGDFGNNRGDRENLHILRADKTSLKSGQPSIDTIWFTYSDQQSLVSTGPYQTEFDCEAFIVSSDSIYLFSKQWLSGNTTLYVLPKLPGSHMARKRESFFVQGQVTGATWLEEERLLVLCGHTGLIQPFFYLFFDYFGNDFFSGDHMRVNLNLPFHQVEAVHTLDGLQYYITNEHFMLDSYLEIPQKLHKIDLIEQLGAYLNGR